MHLPYLNGASSISYLSANAAEIFSIVARWVMCIKNIRGRYRSERGIKCGCGYRDHGDDMVHSRICAHASTDIL